ncbi:MAG: molybdate ABC transporter substrate-binding protein [Nitrospiraceae bacterium]|nr:molybdate ABC transporter substrate-binding protein [Nitrospiraceae bacterium]MSR23543.1 molybdate ABC transporter substrate-binding protein [Nitrospiraceae bacterium]
MKWFGCAIVLAAACGSGFAQAGEITVAAASDLSFALKEAASRFERQTGTRAKITLGSSGNLFSQIQNGAPFDAYFSADVRYPQKLEESGQAVPGSLYRYAIGRLVLWVPNRHGLPSPQQGLQALRDPAVRKIAIANPKHAPYGRAAAEAMRHAGVYEAVKDKLVLGENISQAAQFVESGAADAGLLALSLAVVPAMQQAGRYWEISQEAHSPIEQGAVVLKNGRNREGAQAFLSFLQQREGREILRRYGFVLPGAAQP